MQIGIAKVLGRNLFFWLGEPFFHVILFASLNLLSKSKLQLSPFLNNHEFSISNVISCIEPIVGYSIS